jgi:3-oxoacyl-[acyl-carrier-protein] synthase-3
VGGLKAANEASDSPARALRPVAIAGLGASVPEKVLTNSDLEKMVDTSDEWIRTRTGIRERRIVEPGTGASSLAAAAAREALDDAGVAAEDLDIVIVGTFTPDCPFPSCACLVQEMIGARDAAAFDLNAMCSGFVYGLAVGSQSVMTGAAGNVLVIGVEVLSAVTDYQDRNTCILFGDGAGAAVLSASPDGHEVLNTWMGADGSGFELIWAPAGGSRRPASEETVRSREHFLKMQGRKVFRAAVHKFQEGIRRAAEAAGWGLDEIDLIVPHQVNTRIIDAIVERLEIPGEKVYQNLDRYGNTSAASIPLALHEAAAAGAIPPGAKVVLVAVGGGLTFASAAIRW